MWPVTPCGSRDRQRGVAVRGTAASRRAPCRPRRRRTRGSAPARRASARPCLSGLPTSSASSRASSSACSSTLRADRARARGRARRRSARPHSPSSAALRGGDGGVDVGGRAARDRAPAALPSDGFVERAGSRRPPAARQRAADQHAGRCRTESIDACATSVSCARDGAEFWAIIGEPSRRSTLTVTPSASSCSSASRPSSPRCSPPRR